MKQHTASINNCETFTCINEVDSSIQTNLEIQGHKMHQIYLIRHAKPDLKKNAFYSKNQVNKYLKEYSNANITPINHDLISVNINNNHTIYSSKLRRSKETAKSIFSDKYTIVSDSIFNEFENKAINAPAFIHLPLSLWQVLNRGSWMLGLNHKGIESSKEAKKRALDASTKLIKCAQQEETTILVAHGMLNGAIKKSLKKRGWKVIQSKGHQNLGATILIQVE